MTLPNYSCVKLHGLNKGAQYNDQNGVVLDFNGERHTVFLWSTQKQLKVRPVNLTETKFDAAELSIGQLKKVLAAKAVSLDGVSDKLELVDKVKNECSDDFALRNVAPEAKPTTQTTAAAVPAANSSDPMRLAAQQMQNMTPEQLRARASAIRAMSSSQLQALKSSNPQFAGLSEDQIRASADQLELLASNPSMMKAAAAQWASASNLNTGGDSASPPAAPASPLPPGAMPSSDQMKAAAQQLENMSPDQLRAQVQAMRSMDSSQIAMLRSQNPQFSGMSDEQIKQTADQLEMFANNPEMLKMATQQLSQAADKPGTPGSTAAEQPAQTGGTATTSPSANTSIPTPSMDMGEMLKTMEPEAMQKMIKMQLDMMKNMTPEQIDGMLNSNPALRGLGREGLENQLRTMAEMDPNQFERTVKMSQTVQAVAAPAMAAYASANKAVGGHLMSILVVLVGIVLCFMVEYFFLRSSDE